MDINFHYYLIKSLALTAGFDNEQSEKVATFSQMVDDFEFQKTNMNVLKRPPQFFFDHGFAWKNKIRRGYKFDPVITGIAEVASVSRKVQLKTILPFHFIPLSKVSSGYSDENIARCERGDTNGALVTKLVDEVLYEVQQAKAKKDEGLLKKLPIKFGMLLHIYADSFAHEHFSGMKSWMNVARMTDCYNKFRKSNKNLGPDPNIREKEILAIGHMKIRHIPDAFALQFNYKAKKSSGSGDLDTTRSRYNMDTFMICAGRIYEFMCRYLRNEYTNRDQETFMSIKNLLISAAGLAVEGENEKEEVDLKKLTSNWKKYFPNYIYDYRKMRYFGLNVAAVEDADYVSLAEHGYSTEDLYEVEDERGYKAREYATVRFQEPSEEFYYYNQIAYEHRFHVIGRYDVD